MSVGNCSCYKHIYCRFAAELPTHVMDQDPRPLITRQEGHIPLTQKCLCNLLWYSAFDLLQAPVVILDSAHCNPPWRAPALNGCGSSTKAIMAIKWDQLCLKTCGPPLGSGVMLPPKHSYGVEAWNHSPGSSVHPCFISQSCISPIYPYYKLFPGVSSPSPPISWQFPPDTYQFFM